LLVFDLRKFREWVFTGAEFIARLLLFGSGFDLRGFSFCALI
jgi:hypothetical protein